jgi:hypothetical protein
VRPFGDKKHFGDLYRLIRYSMSLTFLDVAIVPSAVQSKNKTFWLD